MTLFKKNHKNLTVLFTLCLCPLHHLLLLITNEDSNYLTDGKSALLLLRTTELGFIWGALTSVTFHLPQLIPSLFSHH